MGEYEYMDKLPHDSKIPQNPHPSAVDLVLPQLPLSSFNIKSFIVSSLIFAFAASPIIDYYIGKRLPWYGVLLVKLLMFMILYSSVMIYIL
jgi:hypothetical protein